jgi:adenosylmethionine-8-amino-7-oxononanoate aminotransferase
MSALSSLQTAQPGSTAELQLLDQAHLVHPHQVIGQPAPPIVLVRGEGALVWDSDGNEYVDGTCGLWQCAVGHGRAELVQAATEQMGRLEFYASFWDLSNEPAIRLGARLAQLAGDGLDHVHFTSGGSEGNAVAIKLARLAWDRAGMPDRDVILSRRGAYHGSGAGASLAATGLPPLHEGFGPLPEGFVHLSTPHAGRGAEGGDVDALVQELEDTIARIGAERIAAFIGEPIMGVAGVVLPPEGYWPRVEAVLRRHGILLIFDEVITAFGRLGHWFAAERFDVRPDMIVTAKAITSGYVPFGAVLIGERPMELLDGQLLRHGFTYNAHPVGAAVAMANLDVIEREGLLERVRETGAYLGAQLQELAAHDAVAEVRGEGLMWAIELVEGDAVALAATIRSRGAIVRGMVQSMTVSPPFTIERSQVDRLVDTVAGAVGAR